MSVYVFYKSQKVNESQFIEYLDQLLEEKKNCIITGDFNNDALELTHTAKLLLTQEICRFNTIQWLLYT